MTKVYFIALAKTILPLDKKEGEKR